MIHFLKAAGLLLLLFIPPSFVQADDKAGDMAGEGIDRLRFMDGRWTVVTAFYDDGEWGEPLPPARATADTVLGGSFVRLHAPVAFPGATFQFEMTLSYDRFHNVYRFAFLDDLNGYLDVYAGAFEGDVLTVDNATSGTAFPDGNGGSVIGKLEIARQEAGFQILGYIAGKAEGPYTPYMRLRFTPAE